MNTKNKTLAVFDFDGTMTYKDTLVPFLAYSFGKIHTYWTLFKLTPSLVKFPLGLQSRQKTKEIILEAFLQKMPLKTLNELAQSFANNQLHKYLKKTALTRFKWHKSQGHLCVLISANLEPILLPWSKRVGMDVVLASKVEVNGNQLITGRLLGKNCWGEEKVLRLKEYFGHKKDYQIYVYGDSLGDRELLKIADFPHYRVFT